MEEYDLITDSFGGELGLALLAERLWAKVSEYLGAKDEEKKASDLDKRLDEIEKASSALDERTKGIQDNIKYLKSK